MKIYLYFYGILLTALCTLSEKINRDKKTNKQLPSNETLELQMVNILFRHGDRAPRRYPSEMFPTDPNINDKFYPMGHGGLTNNGKKRAYVLGQFLRERYDTFLGSTYLPEDVQAKSTYVDRAQMTLLLVLAGLYPPDKDQNWHKFLNWQPITIHFENSEIHSWLRPANCPRLKALQEEVRRLPEIKEKSSEFTHFWRKLRKFSGENFTSSRDVLHIYNTLIAERAMNLSIPNWAQNILDNQELERAAAFEILIKNYNTTIRKLNGGKLLREMQYNMNARIKNKSFKRGKKINLYSAHDVNVAAHLLALGVAEPHQPYFASAVILELYRDYQNDKHYIQVLYRMGDTGEVQTMKIPDSLNYYEMCEFYKFKDLMKDVTPTDDELQCT